MTRVDKNAGRSAISGMAPGFLPIARVPPAAGRAGGVVSHPAATVRGRAEIGPNFMQLPLVVAALAGGW
jgi:hypothetical protein